MNPCSSLNTKILSTNNSINIHPNPGKNIFKLNKIVEDIVIYNSIGKIIYKIKNKNSIDLTKFPSGIYLAKLKIESKLFFLKIIKN